MMLLKRYLIFLSTSQLIIYVILIGINEYSFVNENIILNPSLDATLQAPDAITYQSGDFINSFLLQNKLDYVLGQERSYYDGNNWEHALVVSSDSQLAGELVVSVSDEEIDHHYVTIMKEVKLKRNSSCIRNKLFCLDENIVHGGHGEIWRARKVNRNNLMIHNTSYILKRMTIKYRPDILACAKREIYFGEKLVNSNLVAHYISYFTTTDDYWLVFKYEGVSLQSLIYAMTYSGGNALLRPSNIWKKLRTTRAGQVSIRGIMYQLIHALADLHSQGIVHRDLKPSNILLNTESDPKILIADFSSAMDLRSDANLDRKLYGERGPTIDELSLQYASPEVLLSLEGETEISFYSKKPQVNKY